MSFGQTGFRQGGARPVSAFNNDPADTPLPIGAESNLALAVTDATDTLAATGMLGIQGAVARTDAADSIAATFTIQATDTTGTAALVDSTDTLLATGTLAIQGAVARTDAADTLLATGALAVQGVGEGGAVGTEPDIDDANDTMLATATVRLAAIAALQDATDGTVGTGQLKITGAAALVDGTDTLLATAGDGSTHADAALVDAADALTATGTVAQLATTTPVVGGFPAGWPIGQQRRRGYRTTSVDYVLDLPPTLPSVSAQATLVDEDDSCRARILLGPRKYQSLSAKQRLLLLAA